MSEALSALNQLVGLVREDIQQKYKARDTAAARDFARENLFIQTGLKELEQSRATTSALEADAVNKGLNINAIESLNDMQQTNEARKFATKSLEDVNVALKGESDYQRSIKKNLSEFSKGQIDFASVDRDTSGTISDKELGRLTTTVYRDEELQHTTPSAAYIQGLRSKELTAIQATDLARKKEDLSQLKTIGKDLDKKSKLELQILQQQYETGEINKKTLSKKLEALGLETDFLRDTQETRKGILAEEYKKAKTSNDILTIKSKYTEQEINAALANVDAETRNRLKNLGLIDLSIEAQALANEKEKVKLRFLEGSLENQEKLEKLNLNMSAAQLEQLDVAISTAKVGYEMAKKELIMTDVKNENLKRKWEKEEWVFEKEVMDKTITDQQKLIADVNSNAIKLTTFALSQMSFMNFKTNEIKPIVNMMQELQAQAAAGDVSKWEGDFEEFVLENPIYEAIADDLKDLFSATIQIDDTTPKSDPLLRLAPQIDMMSKELQSWSQSDAGKSALEAFKKEYIASLAGRGATQDFSEKQWMDIFLRSSSSTAPRWQTTLSNLHYNNFGVTDEQAEKFRKAMAWQETGIYKDKDLFKEMVSLAKTKPVYEKQLSMFLKDASYYNLGEHESYDSMTDEQFEAFLDSLDN
tara:strand:- start:6754 stop:8682 length:1929 start_codon:yes stop_codon:yes gene_type:complete